MYTNKYLQHPIIQWKGITSFKFIFKTLSSSSWTSTSSNFVTVGGIVVDSFDPIVQYYSQSFDVASSGWDSAETFAKWIYHNKWE